MLKLETYFNKGSLESGLPDLPNIYWGDAHCLQFYTWLLLDKWSTFVLLYL